MEGEGLDERVEPFLCSVHAPEVAEYELSACCLAWWLRRTAVGNELPTAGVACDVVVLLRMPNDVYRAGQVYHFAVEDVEKHALLQRTVHGCIGVLAVGCEDEALAAVPPQQPHGGQKPRDEHRVEVEYCVAWLAEQKSPELLGEEEPKWRLAHLHMAVALRLVNITVGIGADATNGYVYPPR